MCMNICWCFDSNFENEKWKPLKRNELRSDKISLHVSTLSFPFTDSLEITQTEDKRNEWNINLVLRRNLQALIKAGRIE